MDFAPGEELVRLRINGPGGPGWVVLQQDMPLDTLRQVLEAKAADVLAKTLHPDQAKQEISPKERGETLKLINWVNEQEARLAAMTPEQRHRTQELNEKQAAARQKSTEKQLEKLCRDEQLGKRITVYQSDGGVTSVSEASSKEQLELAQKYVGHRLDDDRARTIDEWVDQAPETSKRKQPNITIKNADGDGFHTLSDKTNPDLLKLAITERKDSLSAAQVKQIESWIQKAPKGDPDKVRIFHVGPDHPEQSSEISLSLHGKVFYDELAAQLSGNAYMLPEHKSMVDKHYKNLTAGKTKDQNFLEIPSDLPGRFTYLPKDADKETLQVTLNTRDQLLTPELKAKLQQAIQRAPEPEKKAGQLRIYDLNDPSRFFVVSKATSPEDIDKAVAILGCGSAYMRKDDAATLAGWLSAPPKNKTQALVEILPGAINAQHVSGISVAIDDELISKHPDKVKDILNDEGWTLAKDHREQLRDKLEQDKPKSKSPADEFQYEGQTYSKKTSLGKLKDLAGRIADDDDNQLAPEHAKKLLTWISRKEKYGDDPVPSSAYNSERSKEEEGWRQRYKHLARLDSLLNHMTSNQAATVDGYYSEQWGADKSPLAAGPMGAASGGLRPMGIWQFTEVLQSAMRDKLYKMQLEDTHEASKTALDVKADYEAIEVPLDFSRFRDIGHGSGTMSKEEKQIHKLGKEKLDIVITQMYRSIQQYKSKEMSRKPNRDNKDIEENLLPGPGAYRGPGGFGGFEL